MGESGDDLGNDPQNPFSCVLASDLLLPEAWANALERCREAGMPEDLRHRPKWPIGLEQVADAANTLAWNIWTRWPHSWALLIQRCEYYQGLNQASYDSRKRTSRRNQKRLDSS